MKIVNAQNCVAFFTLFSTLSADARNRVVERGVCANGVLTKLVINRDGPGLEIEYEVEEARPGQLWRIVIKQNGRTLIRTSRSTNGDGDLEIETIAPNLRGRDRIVVIARGAGQRCVTRARVRF